MLKIIAVSIISLFSFTFAQSDSWSCEVTKKTVTGKDYVKTWSIVNGTYTTSIKDTTTIINMTDAHAQIFSFGNTSVKKACKQYGFEYDKSENYCEGYITKGVIKKMLKGKIPSKLLGSLLDTMSTDELLNMITSKNTAIETIKFENGYGERVFASGEQTSFELTISRDDEYYFEATNGVITQSTIKLNKRNNTYKMDINATFLDAYFEMEGTCIKQ